MSGAVFAFFKDPSSLFFRAGYFVRASAFVLQGEALYIYFIHNLADPFSSTQLLSSLFLHIS